MIEIYDNFDNALGEYPHYDTYDSGQRTQLALQKHVDIRSFIPVTETRAFTMFDLDGETMTWLDGETMQQLETGFSLQPNEAWTAGTVGAQSDRNHFYGISLTCAIGSTQTQSVMSNLIDISSFGGSDYISLALPAFPQASLTLSSTYLDLSSDGLTTACSLPFSSATLIQNGADYEARFPISLVTGIDKTRINAIRFRITATASCAFRCLAIRAITSTWKFAPVDQNTLFGFLGATVPPTGSLSQSYTFPTAAGVTPSNWPILLRSDGESGPTLVDADLGVSIHAGSGTGLNILSFYLRELPMTWRTMAQMETMTMGELAALQRMPDWTPGTQDNFSQAQYTKITLKWGTTNQLTITDTITAQTFTYTTPGLSPGLDYYILAQLEDESLRIRIYEMSYAGDIQWDVPVFDSTAIVDDNFNRRRAGRFGWYADIVDGDCWVRMLRPRRIVYGEYRSAPFPSITPVVGAQIYASATPGLELAGSTTAYRNAIVTPDVTKSRSGHCWAVKCTGGMLEGVQVGGGVAGGIIPITFSNFFDTFITFDMLSSKATQFVALLRGDTRIIVLFQTVFQPNIWTHVDIPLEQLGENFIPGDYYLYLVQSDPTANIFYIDNLSISTQTVSWQGRTPAPDPWKLNNTPWIKYGDKINSPYDGAILGRGNTLQVRGQVVDQSGAIDRVKIIPQYATLGNLVWADKEPNYGTPPVARIAALSTNDLTVTGRGSGVGGSTFPNGVGQYLWEWGDGSFSYGGISSHTYQLPGTYHVTLTAIDAYGQKNSISGNVTVSLNVTILGPPPAQIDAIASAPAIGNVNSFSPPAAQVQANAPIPMLVRPGIALATGSTPVPQITITSIRAVVDATGTGPSLSQTPVPPGKIQGQPRGPVPALAFAASHAVADANTHTPSPEFDLFPPDAVADANAPAPTVTIT